MIEGTVLESEEARYRLASWLVTCIVHLIQLTMFTYKESEHLRFLRALAVEIASVLFVWPACAVWLLERAEKKFPELAELADGLIRVLGEIDGETASAPPFFKNCPS